MTFRDSDFQEPLDRLCDEKKIPRIKLFSVQKAADLGWLITLAIFVLLALLCGCSSDEGPTPQDKALTKGLVGCAEKHEQLEERVSNLLDRVKRLEDESDRMSGRWTASVASIDKLKKCLEDDYPACSGIVATVQNLVRGKWVCPKGFKKIPFTKRAKEAYEEYWIHPIKGSARCYKLDYIDDQLGFIDDVDKIDVGDVCNMAEAELGENRCWCKYGD
jgi:hypothetical protein